MLSPSYDTRKKMGETNDDSLIANDVVKEYYRYFRSTLHGAALMKMSTEEKEVFRKQNCILFQVYVFLCVLVIGVSSAQVIYDSCREMVLREMGDELNKAMMQMLEPSQAGELDEVEFDRKCACGLLLQQCIRSRAQSAEDQACSPIQNCDGGITASAEQTLSDDERHMNSEKRRLQQEIERLKQKQAEQLSSGGIALPPEELERLKQSHNDVVKAMKGQLESLTELPEGVSNNGRMAKTSDEQSFYNCQNAYGLLLSAHKLELTAAKVEQIIFDANRKLGIHEVIPDRSDAVKLAWSMFKCVPPLIACQPVKYTIAWHEKMPAHWADLEGPYTLIYYQPLLLFTPYGPVAEKGQVGRRPADAESCVNKAEDDPSSDQEDSTGVSEHPSLIKQGSRDLEAACSNEPGFENQNRSRNLPDCCKQS